MSVSDDLFDHLATIALIGGPAAPRLYRRKLPAPIPDMPALTFFRITTGFEYAHDGDSTLIGPRYQVSCWAETGAGAETLARTVQQRMDTWHTIFGGAAIPIEQYDMIESETGMFHVPIDFRIWYNQ